MNEMPDWTRARIEDLGISGDVVQTGPFGAQLHAEDYVKEGVPLILIRNIKESGLDETGMPRIREEDALRLSKYSLMPGDIVFSRVGRVGSCFLAKQEHKGWIISGQTLRTRTDPHKIYPAFLFYALQQDSVKEYISGASVGTTRTSINTTILENIEIPIPPLPEQKKIAEILSGIDKMINGISEAIEKSETKLTGIFADLDLIASSGKTTELGEVACIQNGYAFQSSVFTEDPLGIPLIRISNISGGIVDASKSKKIPRTQVPSDEYKVAKGDILIAMSGATTGKIGRYQGDTFCLLNQRVGKFVFHPGGSGAAYVSQLLLSGFLESRILSKAAGGAQPNISGKGIEGIEIPFPDAAEQSGYGNTIQELLRVNSVRKDLVEKYQHLKSAISADLLSGRKRVSV
jgi:type I restriction enzyme S subunit